MSNWRFAFSRRWFSYLGLVVLFAVACVLLSQWQFARRAESVAEIQLVEQNWSSAPQALDELLPRLSSFDTDDSWAPVTMEGHYLLEEQLLVRGRPMNGAAGFEVLVPLRLEDGRIFIVDRGWLPAGNDSDIPDAVPAAPSGEVTVVARLKPGEPTIPGRSAPPGQLATIHLPTVAVQLGEPTFTGAYGILASENPAPASRPVAAVKPVADEGPHLSYAFQWLMFALLAFVALGWAVRQEYRIRNQDDPAERARAERRQRRANAREATDAEIEDAALDRADAN